jgi:hypothetical protein
MARHLACMSCFSIVSCALAFFVYFYPTANVQYTIQKLLITEHKLQ